MKAHRGKVLAVTAAVAASLGGCGGPTDEEQIRETVSELVAAYASKDGAKACSLMTPATQRRIQASAGLLKGKDCGATLTNIASLPTGELARSIRNFRAGKIVVDGDEAGVVIEPSSPGTKPTRMIKVDGKWYVDGSVSLVR